MLDIFRIHAFEVVPAASEEDLPDLPGGRLEITDEFELAIEENFDRAEFLTRTFVEFEMDAEERHSLMRERVLNYGFGDEETADAEAEAMAERLALAMDQRSRPGLFVVVTGRDGDRREVTLWVFPRDEALQLRGGGDGEASVDVLTDVFSQTSRLRKAAKFEGRNAEADFLRGRVLDHQANQSARTVADFWIGDFLGCRFGISGSQGSEFLGRQFRSALEDVESAEAREQLHGAIHAVRTRNNQNLSMRQVGEEYLDGEAREAFEDALPSERNADSVFEFDREAFDREIRFSIYELESGVVVAVPTIGEEEAVDIERLEEEERWLACDGRIISEKLRKQA